MTVYFPITDWELSLSVVSFQIPCPLKQSLASKGKHAEPSTNQSGQSRPNTLDWLHHQTVCVQYECVLKAGPKLPVWASQWNIVGFYSILTLHAFQCLQQQACVLHHISFLGLSNLQEKKVHLVKDKVKVTREDLRSADHGKHPFI